MCSVEFEFVFVEVGSTYLSSRRIKSCSAMLVNVVDEVDGIVRVPYETFFDDIKYLSLEGKEWVTFFMYGIDEFFIYFGGWRFIKGLVNFRVDDCWRGIPCGFWYGGVPIVNGGGRGFIFFIRDVCEVDLNEVGSMCCSG